MARAEAASTFVRCGCVFLRISIRENGNIFIYAAANQGDGGSSKSSTREKKFSNCANGNERFICVHTIV